MKRNRNRFKKKIMNKTLLNTCFLFSKRKRRKKKRLQKIILKSCWQYLMRMRMIRRKPIRKLTRP